MMEIISRLSFSFSANVEGTTYNFQIFAPTREDAIKQLLNALQKISADLQAELSKFRDQPSSTEH